MSRSPSAEPPPPWFSECAWLIDFVNRRYGPEDPKDWKMVTQEFNRHFRTNKSQRGVLVTYSNLLRRGRARNSNKKRPRSLDGTADDPDADAGDGANAGRASGSRGGRGGRGGRAGRGGWSGRGGRGGQRHGLRSSRRTMRPADSAAAHDPDAAEPQPDGDTSGDAGQGAGSSGGDASNEDASNDGGSDGGRVDDDTASDSSSSNPQQQ